MSGVGSNRPTWDNVRQALEAHAKEVYGEEYVLQDFVALGYVVSMGDESDDDESEYVLVTSTKAEHIIDGLVQQVKLFGQSEE